MRNVLSLVLIKNSLSIAWLLLFFSCQLPTPNLVEVEAIKGVVKFKVPPNWIKIDTPGYTDETLLEQPFFGEGKHFGCHIEFEKIRNIEKLDDILKNNVRGIEIRGVNVKIVSAVVNKNIIHIEAAAPFNGKPNYAFNHITYLYKNNSIQFHFRYPDNNKNKKMIRDIIKTIEINSSELKPYNN